MEFLAYNLVSFNIFNNQFQSETSNVFVSSMKLIICSDFIIDLYVKRCELSLNHPLFTASLVSDTNTYLGI